MFFHLFIIKFDDILIAYKNMFEINKLKTQLQGEFEMKDLTATKKILGMEIHRDQEAWKLYLSQKSTLRKYWNTLECKGQNQ